MFFDRASDPHRRPTSLGAEFGLGFPFRPEDELLRARSGTWRDRVDRLPLEADELALVVSDIPVHEASLVGAVLPARVHELHKATLENRVSVRPCCRSSPVNNVVAWESRERAPAREARSEGQAPELDAILVDDGMYATGL